MKTLLQSEGGSLVDGGTLHQCLWAGVEQAGKAHQD